MPSSAEPEAVVALGQRARVARQVARREARAHRVELAPSRAGAARRAWSIAAFRKNASTIGAGPLIVIETDVLGAHRSKPE